ncbi:PEGA domain-containing protein [Haliangium sp.]|uniref:PEGA domain-containing protein n=1 Tax=Haliangium sp. TaxID=2663208 RepID=UPI003D099C63
MIGPGRGRPGAVVVAAALAALVVIAAGAAHAQRDNDRRAEAERLFRAGESAYNDGQYLIAAAAFEQAYELLPLPAIAFSAAQAYRLQYFIDKDSGHLLDAIELYRKYLGEVRQGGRRDDAAAGLAELEVIRARLEREGALLPRRRDTNARTQLMITTQVEDATATVDGSDGTTPLVVEVAPGEHQVEVRAEGYFPRRQTAVAVEGRLIVVELELAPEPARLTVVAAPGAAVAVDGRPAGETPLARPLAIPAGRHFVTVSRRGRQPWARELDFERGRGVELRPALEITGQRRASYWLLGLAGVTLAGAGVSGTFAWLADRDLAKLEDQRRTGSLTRGEFDEYRRLQDVRDNRLRITYGVLGAGALAAITGGVLYWFDTPRVQTGEGRFDAPGTGPEPGPAPVPGGLGAGASASVRAPLWLIPVVEPGGVGFAATGTF